MSATAGFLAGVFAMGVALGETLAWMWHQVRRARMHHRWRNRRFLRTVRELELRSRDRGRGGSEEEAGDGSPLLSAMAGGGVRPDFAALPPAPSRLAGAVTPDPASARPSLVRLGGAR